MEGSFKNQISDKQFDDFCQNLEDFSIWDEQNPLHK